MGGGGGGPGTLLNQGRSQDFWRGGGGGGSAIWSEATDSTTSFASEASRSAADQATAVIKGATSLGGLGAKPLVEVRGAKPPRTKFWIL